MKKIIYCLAILILMISSCVPSLHPIYTEDTLITNDMLEGKWVSERQISLKPSIEVVADDEAAINKGKEFLKNIGKSKQDHWLFERATEIKAFKKGATGETKIDLEIGTPSLLSLDEEWEVKVGKKHPFYILSYTEETLGDTIKTTMLCHLTSIGKDTYINFFPYDLKSKKKRSRFSANFVSAHSFAKIMVGKNKIVIKPFDAEKLESLLKSNRLRLKYESIGDRIILTASTQELRSFLEKYGDRDDLFDEEEILAQDI